MFAADLFTSLSGQGYIFGRDGEHLVVDGPPLTDDLSALIRKNKAELLELLELRRVAEREERRRKLFQMMAEDDQPKKQKHYWLTDTEANLEFVILALAIPDVCTCELLIPRERYDPFLLLESIGKEH